MHVAQAYGPELAAIVPKCTRVLPWDGVASVLEVGASERRAVTARECELRCLTFAAPLYGELASGAPGVPPTRVLLAEVPIEVAPSTYIVHGKRRVVMARLRLARLAPLHPSSSALSASALTALRTSRGELIVRQADVLVDGAAVPDDDPRVLPELGAAERVRVLANARRQGALRFSRDACSMRRVYGAREATLALLRASFRAARARVARLPPARARDAWPAQHVTGVITRALATGAWPGARGAVGNTHAQATSNAVAQRAQLRTLVARETRCTGAARAVCGEQLGALCPVDTPEGHMVGLTKHLAAGCRVSEASAAARVLQALALALPGNDRAFFDGVPAARRVNGAAAAMRLRAARTGDESVTWHVNARELWVWCDAGRMMVDVGQGRCVDVGELASLGDAAPAPRRVLSACAATIPFCAHNQAARATFQCAQIKQALGSWDVDLPPAPPRARTLWYAQRPLVRCEDVAPGLNVTVCVTTYGGFNQEDAIVVSRAAVERGLFRSDVVRSYVNPPRAKEADADDSAPAPGARGAGGARVDASFVGVDANGERLRVVRERAQCVPQAGDKFTSRHGQKGVVSLAAREEDLPFDASTGIVPDVVFNPHGIPSRMTVGQVMEICFGKLCAARGRAHETTALARADAGELAAALHAAGFARSGGARMLCGKTGRPIDAVLLTGCVFMQALPHFADEKCYARGRFGACDPATGQPLAGRASGGGLRVGEMEKNALLAHGADATLHDRFVGSSDARRTDVCRACGRANARHAVTNLCVHCNGAEFAEGARLSTSFQSLVHHAAACGVGMSLECSEQTL